MLTDKDLEEAKSINSESYRAEVKENSEEVPDELSAYCRNCKHGMLTLGTDIIPCELKPPCKQFERR